MRTTRPTMEAWTAGVSLTDLNLFQSHIGAIRMRARARYREEGINFNPTLVQLEFILGGESVYQDDEFQSHIGAIRIGESVSIEKNTKIFQSHIGAIRILTSMTF